MSTQALVLGGIAIFLLLNSSSQDGSLLGGAKPAERVGGARTYGPGAPLPAQAPSGSPGGQTQGVSTLGALYTNILGNADKVGAGIADIITAVRATDDKSGDDGSGVAAPVGPPPLLARDSGSGATWIGFLGGGAVPPTDPSTNAPGDWSQITFAQGSALDQAVPDWGPGTVDV